jgi:8-amino-7-oxononanoate synthase
VKNDSAAAEEMGGGRDWASLEEDCAGLRAAGLWRELRRIDRRDPAGMVETGGRLMRGFASNDYLGLAESAALREALREGVQRWGAGAGASRLVCGTHAPHEELEQRLAGLKGTAAALVFSSGFAAALGVIPALAGTGDTIILDKLSHASLVDGARLSGATVRVFPHNHTAKLARLLAGARGRTLVITESVFSMDGDRAALREIVELKDRFGAWLLLDEAHAFGVLGPRGLGLAAELGLEDRVELKMGTLSKAAGLSGGYLACNQMTRDWLVNRARSFVYSTAPPPFLAHAASCALELLTGAEGERRRARLRDNTALFQRLTGREGADFSSAIIPLIIGDERAAVNLSERLRKRGYWIPAIRYPTVARGAARLRITLTSEIPAAEIEVLAEALREFGGSTVKTVDAA